MKIFDFISPLPPEECLRRLRANVEREKWTWSTGSAPSKAEVVGKVEEARIRLYRPNTGNLFRSTYPADSPPMGIKRGSAVASGCTHL